MLTYEDVKATEAAFKSAKHSYLHEHGWEINCNGFWNKRVGERMWVDVPLHDAIQMQSLVDAELEAALEKNHA